MGRVLLALVSTLFMVIQVMAGSWTPNNFLYKPAIGARGDDEKAKFDIGLNRVDSRLANEKWLNDSPYNGDLGAALTAIGSAKAVLNLPAGNWSIAANLTVPANLTLKFAHGALLTIATGNTLTINGPIESQPHQIFSYTGTGKVVFGSQKVVYPEWWGAVINASGTDCGSALNQAIAALPKGGVIEFQSGIYHIGTQVNLATDITFKGYGGMAAAGTILQRSADVVMFAGTGVSMLDPLFNMNQIYRNRFTGIKFNGTPLGTTYSSDLISLKACMNFTFDNCQFLTLGRVIYAWELYDSRFTDCYFQWCGNAAGSVPVVELKSSDTTYEMTNNIYFTNCVFEANRFTCVKTTGAVPGYPTNQIKFVNTKFDNTDLTGPTLDLLNAQQVHFTNTFINVLRNVPITEVVKFDKCDQIEGNLWVLVSNFGTQAVTRIMTINTNAGANACRMNLFLTGINWDFITESAAVKIDASAQAPWINIKTFGPSPGNAGWACSTKALTNYPLQTEALYGSSIQTYAPSGGAGDWMAIFTHGLAAGGPDVWVNRVIESGPSTYMEWVLNNLPLFRLIYNGVVQVVTGDLQINTAGKGVILTNTAGTVTKRVRLNDAGNGLIFEAP